MHKPPGDFGGRCHLSFLENHQRWAIIKLLALNETETILMALWMVCSVDLAAKVAGTRPICNSFRFSPLCSPDTKHEMATIWLANKHVYNSVCAINFVKFKQCKAKQIIAASMAALRIRPMLIREKNDI